jgi:predicted kinase
MLIIFGGLPATGKTTIAKELARQIGATYLRIDTIEQAIRDPTTMRQPITDEGYRVAYAVAEDNLRLGRTVISIL